MYHSECFWGRIFTPLSCCANRQGNFSKWSTTTHVAALSLSPSSQQPTNNTSTPGTRQKEYWHIFHCIKSKLKLKDMGFITISVHMTQGCVSVGMIPIKPEVKENACQAFFSFIPWYPPSITGKNKIIWDRGVCIWRNRMAARGTFCFFTHLPHSGGKNITYRLITLKNNQRRSLIFQWVQNLESTSSGMCYMHWLSCPSHCLHHAVKNPRLLILSLDTWSLLLNASLLCMWVSFLTRHLFHSSQE